MPYVTLKSETGNVKLYYEDTDPNNTEKPVIYFAHGLLWSSRMWDEQVKGLQEQYRCIRMDFRGQGNSAVTKSGYDMDSLAEDVILLLAHLNVQQYYFVGLSMGGFVGQRLALQQPNALLKLILLNTSADPEPEENIPGYNLLVKISSILSPRAVMKDLVKIMHGKTFLSEAKKDKGKKEKLKLFKAMMANNKRKAIKKTVHGVISRDGVLERIHAIKQPTLIIVGDEDVATPLSKAQKIHMQINGSKFVVIENAGHMSAMEKPVLVTSLIRDFIA